MEQLKTVELQIEIIKDSGEYTPLDISQNEPFAFNFSASDLTNPAITKIPYSVTIAIPKTQRNNKIFDQMGKIDSQILNFNPIYRTNFRLYVNNNLYQSGYMKLISASQTDYKIRMYGGLGDFFYTLSEVSDENDFSLKSLEFGDSFNHEINRSTISTFWSSDNGGKKITYFDYSANNGAGGNVTEEGLNYAMTYQGEYDNFDSNNVIDSNGDVKEVTWFNNKGKEYAQPVLNEHRRNTNVFSGEYRSYYQKPMIKFKIIYNKIIEKISALGWKVNLDSSFFNQYNPYWNDLWCIFPNYDTTANNAALDIKVGKSDGEIVESSPEFNHTDTTFKDQFDVTIGYSGEIIPGETYNIVVYIPFKIRKIKRGGATDDLEQKRNYLYLYATLKIGGVEHRLQFKDNKEDLIILNKNTVRRVKGLPDFYYSKMDIEAVEAGEEGSVYEFYGNISYQATGTTSPSMTLRFDVLGQTDWELYRNGNGRAAAARIDILKGARISLGSNKDAGLRSGADITYTDIVTSEATCFDFLINYGKLFGLYYIKDENEKSVNIVTRNTYFAAQEKLDWTNKIDINQDRITEPVPFNYKTGVFKWNDLETKYEKEYVSKTGKEYGSARFHTLYEFSNEEKDYIDNILFDNCIIATDYSQYYLDRTNIMYKDNKILPFFQDNAGARVDTGIVLVFKNGLNTVDRPFAITDDTPGMLTVGYMWTGDRDYIQEYKTYPNLVRTLFINGGNYSLNFGRPATTYNDNEKDIEDRDTEAGSETLYARFWRSYLRDRFNENNRLLTCYVDINLIDVQTNLLNKFIYIDNTVWVIDKIHQFNPLDKNPTQVTLINVQNVSNYLAQSYITGNLIISKDGEVIYNPAGTPDANPVIIRTTSDAQDITISINSTTAWRIDNLPDGVTCEPQSGTDEPEVTISVPENTTGTALYNNINIIWGNTTTILQIIQVSNWTVTTTTNNGTSTATGAGSTGEVIRVPDGTQIEITTDSENDWVFAYWIIDGVRNASQTVTLTVTNDVQADAMWLNPEDFVKMVCEDENTTVTLNNSLVEKFGNYWLLTADQTYVFHNPEETLSGYLFDDDTLYTSPGTSVSRTISETDTTLTVYYNTLLSNIHIINNSDANFLSQSIVITSPTGGVIPSPTGMVSANTELNLKYLFPTVNYGEYSFNVSNPPAGAWVTVSPTSIDYQQGSAIPIVSVLVENLKWGSDIAPITADEQTVTNTIYLPENFSFNSVDSDTEGVTCDPQSGVNGTDVTISVPENTTGADRTITISAPVYNDTSFIRIISFTIYQGSN